MRRRGERRRLPISRRSRTDRCRREPGEATANAKAQFAAMEAHFDPAGAAVMSGATGVAAPTHGGTGLPGRDSACRCARPPPRSAIAWSRRSRPAWPWRRWPCSTGALFPPLGGRRKADDGAVDAGAGDVLGSLARRGARPGHGSLRRTAMAQDTDHLGRPIVVITGMGVHHLARAGPGGELGGADRRRFRHPPDLPLSDRRAAHDDRRHGGFHLRWRSHRRLPCRSVWRNW